MTYKRKLSAVTTALLLISIWAGCDGTCVGSTENIPTYAELEARCLEAEDRADSLAFHFCVSKKLLLEHKGIWDCYIQWFKDRDLALNTDYGDQEIRIGRTPGCIGHQINVADCHEGI